jgi:hypothetical protein
LNSNGTGDAAVADIDKEHKARHERFIDEYNVPETDDMHKWPCDQHRLSGFVEAKRVAALKAAHPSLGQAVRYKCATAPRAGDWTTAVPSNHITRFAPKEYLMAMALRYGMVAFPDPVDCVDCGKAIDPLGEHALHCGSYGGANLRHNRVRDILAYWAKKALMTVEKEKKGLLYDGCKPADIWIESYKDRMPWAFDITVVSPLKYDIIREAYAEHLAGANDAAAGKYRKYKEDMKGRQFKLQPLAFEATGGFDEAAQMFINKIAKQVASRYGRNPAAVSKQISDEVSCSIMRSTAQMMLRRSVEKCYVK